MTIRSAIKSLSIVLFMLLTSQSSHAQHEIDYLQQVPAGKEVLLYKITQQQARYLLDSTISFRDTSFFNSFVKVIKHHEDLLSLPYGHYLKVSAVGSGLIYDYIPVSPFLIYLLDNSTDLLVQIKDKKTKNSLPDLKVILDKHAVLYDKATDAYRLPESNLKGLLDIRDGNENYYFRIDKSRSTPSSPKTRRNIFRTRTVRSIINTPYLVACIPYDGYLSIKKGRARGSIYRIKQTAKKWYYSWENRLDQHRKRREENKNNKYINTDDYNNYTFFSKPKYRLQDTVSFKVLLMNKKNHWVDIPLTARLRVQNEIFYLGTCTPKNASGYCYTFQMHDSMKFRLDQNYTIELIGRDSLPYTYCNFYVEDYELQKSVFSIECPDKEQIKGKCFEIKYTAKDENGLPMRDTKAEVAVTINAVSNIRADQLFVPYQIWKHEFAIEDGIKTLTIPDSIFADANFNYHIKTVLRNAENERKEADFSVSYVQEKSEIRDEFPGDSILIQAYQNDTMISFPARLISVDRYGFHLSEQEIILPYKTLINTHTSTYKIQSSRINKDINMDRTDPMVSCNAHRTGDSIFISINNPRNLPFSYQVYERNKELTRGNARMLNIKCRANEKDLYYMAIQYIWAGKVKSDMYQVPLHNKLVNLKVDQPLIIYPGKEAEITITATDYKNRLVENMSILTFGYTAKFAGSSTPILPDFSSKQRSKYVINNFSERSDFSSNKITQLNYKYWKKHMVLDTILGFRFIYPDKVIEKIEIPAEDSITQFAPFVTDSGQLQGVHYVLLNSLPVYFGFTEHKAPYSFEPGASKYNHVQIRTKNSLITIDSLELKPCYKTIFTVDIHNAMKHVVVKSMPDTLTQQEINDYSNYIIKLNEIDTRSAFRFLSSPYRHGVFKLSTNNSDWRDQKRYANNYRNISERTVGPILNAAYSYNILGEYSIGFEVEHSFIYTFKPQTVKMVSIDKNEQLINTRVNCFVPNLSDWIITTKRINDLFRQKPKQERRMINYASNNNNGTAQLQIELERLAKDTLGNTVEPLNIIITQPGNFNFINIYPGNTRYFNNLQTGNYDLLIMEEYGIYRKVPGVKVQAEGINFYRIKHTDTLNSAKIEKLDSFINTLYDKPYQQHEKDEVLIMSKYLEATYNGPVQTIIGKVLDEQSESLPGATIMIKGTKIGTVTDVDGLFSIEVPSLLIGHAQLIISSLGSCQEGFEILNNKTYVLKNSNQGLSDVMIYGQEIDRRSYTGSRSVITTEDIAQQPVTDFTRILEGSAPGVSTLAGGGQPGSAPDILIRGFGSLSASSNPLIVIDGVVYNGSLDDLNTQDISSMNVLKDAAATAIYGSRGANGVIMITTKKDAKLPDNIKKALGETIPIIPEDVLVSGLRNYFKDDAFWQPNLITDKHGKVSFKVKFPDDLTSWNTFVYATDNKMRMGQTSGNIKSFKPVSASLQAPQFLIQGDSANIIGKSVNYISDTITITNAYFLNDRLQKETNVQLAKYNNEVIPVTAPRQDSIKLKYLLTKTDGYFDGEEKTIAIIPRGVAVAKGAFLSMDGKDTSIIIPPADNEEPLYINATASLIDIVIDEIEKVKNYKHLCNEQLSSKIISLLMQQRIYEAMKKPLNLQHKNDIQKMVNLLLQRQNSSQLWGWWGDGQSVMWISQHVLKALNLARDMHYNIGQLNFERIVQPLVYQWENDTTIADIQSLKLLHTAGMKIDYEKYIRRIEQKKNLTLGQKLEMIHFRQLLKLPYNTKLLSTYKQEDVYGNIFWKDTVAYIYENDVLNTLTAFKILQADSMIKINKHKVINWLIQERKADGWRNIYESSQLIEAIASSIDLADTTALKPVLDFSGGLMEKVTTFPYKQKMNTNETITVHKTGAAPVYFTWYQKQLDTTDNDTGENFIVNTAFEYKTKEVSKLKAGEAIQLKVKVKVIKNSDFVMIDIPIPAGCSYENKSRGYYGNEVHREYYKDRVNIFCEKLPKGDYTYNINLLPRYTGNYTVNPAKAELMYFPVFYGREKMKRIDIE